MLPIEPCCFEAILKTDDDRYLADGTASINVADQSVEFRSQFVPLMLMGTKAKIVRITDGKESHCFSGTVYLSSGKLMRLINVNDSLLAEIELEAMQSVCLPAHVHPHHASGNKLQLVAKRLARFEAEVFGISINRLRFVCSEMFLEDEEVEIDLELPQGPVTLVCRIRQQLLFGEKKTGYRCDILSMSDSGKNSLIHYLSQRIRVFAP